MSSATTSLANLNDIVLPPAPGMWPMATGWYLVFGVLLVLITWFAYRSWRRYRCNGYRRAALAELAEIESLMPVDVGVLLPELLKRTALQVFPRQQVAALNGKSWCEFLNQQCPLRPFDREAGDLLCRLAYEPGDWQSYDLQPLLNAVRTWIQTHEGSSC